MRWSGVSHGQLGKKHTWRVVSRPTKGPRPLAERRDSFYRRVHARRQKTETCALWSGRTEGGIPDLPSKLALPPQLFRPPAGSMVASKWEEQGDGEAEKLDSSPFLKYVRFFTGFQLDQKSLDPGAKHCGLQHAYQAIYQPSSNETCARKTQRQGLDGSSNFRFQQITTPNTRDMEKKARDDSLSRRRRSNQVD